MVELEGNASDGKISLGENINRVGSKTSDNECVKNVKHLSNGNFLDMKAFFDILKNPDRDIVH